MSVSFYNPDRVVSLEGIRIGNTQCWMCNVICEECVKDNLCARCWSLSIHSSYTFLTVNVTEDYRTGYLTTVTQVQKVTVIKTLTELLLARRQGKGRNKK